MGIRVAPELDWYKAELQVSSIPTIPRKAASNLTAQQWAWEFLRRNKEYQKAWTLMSSLSPIQKKQIGCLIDKNLHTLLHDSLIEIAIVRTLNLQFFDQRQLSDFEGFEGDGSLGAYRDHMSKFDDYDPSDFPPVSNRFLLSTYCLKRWADPRQSLETDPAAAAALWIYQQHQECGIEHVPWLGSFDDFNSMSFRPVKSSIGKGKKSPKNVETAGPFAPCVRLVVASLFQGG